MLTVSAAAAARRVRACVSGLVCAMVLREGGEGELRGRLVGKRNISWLAGRQCVHMRHTKSATYGRAQCACVKVLVGAK
jgi:hypothetical protein